MDCRHCHPARIAGLVILTSIIGTGCAPTTQRADVDERAVQEERERQRQLVLRKDLEYQKRLSRVSYPILRASTALCPDDVGRRAGVNISNVYAFKPEYRAAARAELGLDPYLRLIDVTPGSAAEAAGLVAGDVVLAINGKQIQPGPQAVNIGQRQLDRIARSGDDFVFDVAQLEGQKQVTFTPEAICYYPVFLANTNEINAFADGKAIYVTRGMMKFVESDTELAQVIAHEMAHNAMGHIDAKRGNMALGAILDIAAAAYGVDTGGMFGDIASLAHSKGFEAEADYVGMYAMARAGVPYAENADLWRRLAMEHPESINNGILRTHPSSPERFVAIDATVAEVIAKQDAGEELMPNLKRPLRGSKHSRAIFFHDEVEVATMSGTRTTVAPGCWKSAGEVRAGMAYRPSEGGFDVNGRPAALVIDDGEFVGVWQIKKQRLLKLDGEIGGEDTISFGFECKGLDGGQ